MPRREPTTDELDYDLRQLKTLADVTAFAHVLISHRALMCLERDNARANARILAHSYEHDSRPPARVVAESLAYPVWPEQKEHSDG